LIWRLNNPSQEVQTAITIGSTQLLSLNCWFLGDDPDRMFTVEIPKNKNIYELKRLIKEKNPQHLNHIAVSDLDLWQVSFPVDDLCYNDPPIIGLSLLPLNLLSDVFTSMLNIYHIHVVACVPVEGKSYDDSHLILLIIPSRRALSQLDATTICNQNPNHIYQKATSGSREILPLPKARSSFQWWGASTVPQQTKPCRRVHSM
jgi:hypothetical protein